MNGMSLTIVTLPSRIHTDMTVVCHATQTSASKAQLLPQNVPPASQSLSRASKPWGEKTFVLHLTFEHNTFKYYPQFTELKPLFSNCSIYMLSHLRDFGYSAVISTYDQKMPGSNFPILKCCIGWNHLLNEHIIIMLFNQLPLGNIKGAM